MPGPRNPKTLSWTHSGQNTNGSAFNPDLFGGWELEVNGEARVSVPVGWESDGTYEAPIAALELAEADYAARLRLVRRDGVASEWSDPVEFEIRAVPLPPLGLSVA